MGVIRLKYEFNTKWVLYSKGNVHMSIVEYEK